MRACIRNFIQPAALLLPALLACSGAETPERPAQTYRLTAIDGQPLPVLLSATITCDEILVRGTLLLTAEGSHGLALDTAIDCTRSGGQVTPGAKAFSGDYDFHDGVITFHDAGPSSTGDWTGSLHGATIRAVLPPLSPVSAVLLNATFRAT